MSDAVIAPVFYGHEVLSVLSVLGGETDLSTLRRAVFEQLGEGAVFCNCAGDRFDFDELIGFLAAKRKLAVQGDRVSLGPVPGCGGH